MKPIKTFLFVSVALVAGLVTLHIINTSVETRVEQTKIPETSYGAFLAAQHAIYTNNFDTANAFLYKIDTDAQQYKTVAEIRILTDFLNGIIPDNVDNIARTKTLTTGVVYDAYLVQHDDWGKLYKKYRNNDAYIITPLRIWSGVATNYITKTLNYINALNVNPSWQSFLRGQVYAEQGKIKKATDEFDKVSPDFLNIIDYMYLMSFYNHHNLTDQANSLHAKFTGKPGGMFMAKNLNIPDWKLFAGHKNQLAFNLVQSVSHNTGIKYSDLSLLLLHFAKNIADNNSILNDAVNYNSGLYMVENNGNYNKYFSKINSTSPYYPFVNLRLAELNHDKHAVEAAIKAQPLFMPAISRLVAWNTQTNNQHAALKIIDKTLNNPDVSTVAKAYLYKMRAEVNFIFQDVAAAQHDLDSAKILLAKPDADIFSIQARIWAATNKNLNEAYTHGLSLVKFAPMDNCTWDTLGYVIRAREGVMPALDLMSRVAEVATSCSALFEHLGDMYVEIHDFKLAKDAYLRAIELSDDGLSIKPVLEKKLKRIQ